ncbi:RNA polymerase III-inhibiting protein maf1 [Spiromyces aspiralis]|uniref:RNA polymerase III-inhibiting protein maf1 n=1 Tax=Spiromyces aspiralis TaxID=68401 RepID=A0ACC1HKY0_9FUNG|nr:RNA polymerase III-inhibiting protein maf1 [Spiromyces aspiralis]
MKFLQLPAFENINDLLSFTTGSGHRVMVRVEAYTCKSAGADKKLYKYLEQRYHEDAEEAQLSPEFSPLNGMISPFGPLSNSASRKTLFYLIATLNASFPDYDFSSLQADQFKRAPSCQYSINTINTTLMNLDCPVSLKKSEIWEVIDREIDLSDCEVYTYEPDSDSDPFADEGSIMSMYYFFFNKRLKRIVFFSCRCISDIRQTSEYPSEVEDDLFFELEEEGVQDDDDDEEPYSDKAPRSGRRVPK